MTAFAGIITEMTLGVGAIATEVTMSATTLTHVPDDADLTLAVALGLAATTAVDMIDALALTADDVVLVSGATGGVGVYALQLAKATGATVIATSRPGEATDLVRRLGADHVVDHTKDLGGQLDDAGVERVTAIAHGAGDPERWQACSRRAVEWCPPSARLLSRPDAATSK